jgi:hypothetical protein
MSVHEKLHRTILNLHIDHLDHLVTLMRTYTVIAERISLVEEHFRFTSSWFPHFCRTHFFLRYETQNRLYLIITNKKKFPSVSNLGVLGR